MTKIILAAVLSFALGIVTTLVTEEWRGRAESQAHLDATLRATCAQLAENGGRPWVCAP